MKKQAIISLVVVSLTLSISTSITHASPVADSKLEREYLVSDREFSKWCFGVFTLNRKRDVRLQNWDRKFATSSVFMYLGYDILPWLTAFGAAGSTEAEIENLHETDRQGEFMAGFNANILDQAILDPLLMEDRLLLNASAYISSGRANWSGSDTFWTEFNVEATLTVVNDVDGSKLFFPEAIAIYAGPIFSNIQTSAFDEEDKIGYTAGMATYLTKRVSLDFGANTFSDSAYFAGLHVRF